MKNALYALNANVLLAEKIAIGAILAAMGILLTSGVFFRYVLGIPFVWSESIAKLLIVWLTFIGTSVAFAEKKHITVESFLHMMPTTVKPLIRLATVIVTIAILCYMARLGFIYSQGIINNTSPILGISLSFFSYSMPIMFAFAVMHILSNLMLDMNLKAFESPEESNP